MKEGKERWRGTGERDGVRDRERSPIWESSPSGRFKDIKLKERKVKPKPGGFCVLALSSHIHHPDMLAASSSVNTGHQV